MKTLNYAGREMTPEELLKLAAELDHEAGGKRMLAERPKLFDEPMPRELQAQYEQQAAARESEAQTIRNLVQRNQG